jgi:hypothetical protein
LLFFFNKHKKLIFIFYVEVIYILLNQNDNNWLLSGAEAPIVCQIIIRLLPFRLRSVSEMKNNRLLSGAEVPIVCQIIIRLLPFRLRSTSETFRLRSVNEMINNRLLSGAEAPITCQMFRTSTSLSARNISVPLSERNDKQSAAERSRSTDYLPNVSHFGSAQRPKHFGSAQRPLILAKRPFGMRRIIITNS